MNTKALAMLALLLGLAACGGGSDDDSAAQQLRAEGATLQAVDAESGAPVALELRDFEAITIGVDRTPDAAR